MTVHVPKVGLVQLGSPKNLVDSERILTQLRAEGYVLAPGYADADNGRAPPLEWWTPPPEWGMGTHTHHLKNLYIYFWRWAALKVFGSGWHAATGKPEIARQGIVCFITVAEYLKCQIGFPKRQMGRDRNGHS